MRKKFFWMLGEENSVGAVANQTEELEEVHVGVESVLDDLQSQRREGTHGVAYGVEAAPAREDEKALQQRLTASDILQLEVRHSECKLQTEREKGERGE